MQKITDHVFQISLGAVNVFIIEGDGLTLVDSGYKGSTEKIFSALKKAGRHPQDIKRLVLTHSHPDHAGSAAEIKRLLKIPVFAHEADAELLERGVAGRLPHVISPGIIHKAIFHFFIKNVGNEVEALEIDRHLRDNDVIEEAQGMSAIHTPGHSAGHIAFFVKKENLLIAGDLCANMMSLDFSTVYEDRTLGVKSILKAAEVGFDMAVFGHGRPLIGSASQKLKQKFLPLLG
ncbi:MAG TPA: MBL fold metallo-hydrolase [Patescibacteria group bacterium]|nr:MBL fold metallo-hydrolase [Patescibacteria group bacterium]